MKLKGKRILLALFAAYAVVLLAQIYEVVEFAIVQYLIVALFLVAVSAYLLISENKDK